LLGGFGFSLTCVRVHLCMFVLGVLGGFFWGSSNNNCKDSDAKHTERCGQDGGIDYPFPSNITFLTTVFGSG